MLRRLWDRRPAQLGETIRIEQCTALTMPEQKHLHDSLHLLLQPILLLPEPLIDRIIRFFAFDSARSSDVSFAGQDREGS